MKIFETKGARAVGILALAMGLAGCEHVIGGSFGVEAQDEWTRSYTLAEGGQVEVLNVNGRINVEPSGSGQVEVRAERTGKGISQEAAQEALERLEIVEDVPPEHIRLETRVASEGLMGMHSSGNVRYYLKVPATAAVTLVSTNGRINVTGIQGSLEAETTNGRIAGEALSGPVEASATNGRITIEMDAVAQDGIRLETTNGRIKLSLPDTAQANVSARVGNGRVSTSGLTIASDDQSSSRRRIEGQLNGGGPDVELRTANGSISIEAK